MEKLSILESLEKMGLELKEAKTYRTLVSLGSGTVGKISSLTGYSRTKVYAIFDKLLSKGWIKRISDKPKTYAPIDPRQIIAERKDSITLAYETILTDLSPIYNGSRTHVSEIITYRGYEVLKKVEEMLANAKREINVITAFLPIEIVEKEVPLFLELKTRGIKVRCLVSKRFEDNAILKDLGKGFKIKFGSVPEAGMIIIDKDEVLFGAVEAKAHSLSNILGLWTTNKEMIKFCKLIFNQLYKEI